MSLCLWGGRSSQGAHHFAGHGVLGDGGGETDARGALAGGVHRPRRDVAHIPQQLALGHPGVACRVAAPLLASPSTGWASKPAPEMVYQADSQHLVCNRRTTTAAISRTHQTGVDVAPQPHAVVHLLRHPTHQHEQQRLHIPHMHLCQTLTAALPMADADQCLAGRFQVPHVRCARCQTASSCCCHLLDVLVAPDLRRDAARQAGVHIALLLQHLQGLGFRVFS